MKEKNIAHIMLLFRALVHVISLVQGQADYGNQQPAAADLTRSPQSWQKVRSDLIILPAL